MKAILFSLLASTAVWAQDADTYHRRIDNCYRNEVLCVAHVLIDAIFSNKSDTGGEYYSVEFYENWDGRECMSYPIVKTNLRHNQQSENLRKCENLNYEFGSSRTTVCVKVDGKSQPIRSSYVGPACNALAYQ